MKITEITDGKLDETTNSLPWMRKVKFSSYVRESIQGLSQNWWSFSLDALVTPSIGIPIKRIYSIVRYLSNKHHRMPVCQMDLELKLVLWKQLRVPSKKSKENNKWKHKFIHLYHPHLGCTFDIFSSKYCKHASILSTHFLNGGFKLLRNVSKDCLGFLDQLASGLKF